MNLGKLITSLILILLQVQSGSGLVLVLRLFDKGRTSHGPEWYTWCVVLLKTDFFTRS